MINLMSNGFVVIGAGGHCKVIVSTLKELDIHIQAILDDDERKWGMNILGIPISGPIELLMSGNFDKVIIAIGDNKKRKNIAERYNELCKWKSIIHPRSYVHPSAKIGVGSAVFAGAVIQPDVIIGNHVIINTAASIDHDCIIEDYAHVAPGSHLAGNVIVKEGAFLGIGCSVIPNKKIGNWSVVGAGSVVIYDIADYSIAVGVPARPIKENIGE